MAGQVWQGRVGFDKERGGVLGNGKAGMERPAKE